MIDLVTSFQRESQVGLNIATGLTDLMGVSKSVRQFQVAVDVGEFLTGYGDVPVHRGLSEVFFVVLFWECVFNPYAVTFTSSEVRIAESRLLGLCYDMACI